MNRWRAFRSAMRVRRTTRLGSDDVDRLMAGDPSGPGHRGLAALLSAAKAAPTPEELAGERAAVAGFRSAYRETAPAGSSRARRSSPARVVTLKVAASVAVLAVGGTAVAAETGRLPAAAQRQAYELFGDLGVPAPRPGTGRSGADRPGAPTTPPAAGSASPAATTPSGSAAPSGAAPGRARGLCRAWDAQRRPNGKAMTARARQELITLAGGADRIADFCVPHVPGPSAPPSATAGTGHGTGNDTGNPGNGNANNGGGNGNGNNGGNNGNNGGGNGTNSTNRTGNGDNGDADNGDSNGKSNSDGRIGNHTE